MSERVHFIGIGGAGMSALAKVFLERGASVSGSDLKRSSATTMLEAIGAEIAIGHNAANIGEADTVVVSSAIPESNPELVAATGSGRTVMSRGEALALVLRGHRSIVVAGTHGKTTTTSMVVSVLIANGLDPTYLVGGGLNDVGTNARSGSSDIAVAESDESDGSFLLLEPTIAVITNVESDHLDHWGDLGAIEDAFVRFCELVDPDGTIIVPRGISILERVALGSRSVLSFGDTGDVRAEAIEPTTSGMSFLLAISGATAPVELRVPGVHNVQNALAAAAACSAAGLETSAIADGLSAFRGVERRFQIRGDAAGVTVVDDYAHHPTEVSATLAAGRAGRWHRVVAVFQPHRYSRTEAFAGSFGGAFAEADRVIVTDIYGAGEQPVPGVTGKLIVDSICEQLPGKRVAYIPHRDDLLAYLQTTVEHGDLVLTLGAGDINSIGEQLLDSLTPNS